jgi:chromosome segregation ATPase
VESLLPDWGIIIALLSMLGSIGVFILNRRERAARIDSEQAQAELAKKQAKQADAGAVQNISEAAASAVDTMQKVKKEVEGELENTRQAMGEMEARILTLQNHLDVLMLESQGCIDENIRLMKGNEALETENSELLRRVEELVLENQRLQKRVKELETRLAKVMKHVGLTGEDTPIK